MFTGKINNKNTCFCTFHYFCLIIVSKQYLDKPRCWRILTGLESDLHGVCLARNNTAYPLKAPVFIPGFTSVYLAHLYNILCCVGFVYYVIVLSSPCIYCRSLTVLLYCLYFCCHQLNSAFVLSMLMLSFIYPCY